MNDNVYDIGDGSEVMSIASVNRGQPISCNWVMLHFDIFLEVQVPRTLADISTAISMTVIPLPSPRINEQNQEV